MDCSINITKLYDARFKIPFALDINYIIISLPIIDKNRYQSCLIEFLRERIEYYESMSQQI